MAYNLLQCWHIETSIYDLDLLAQESPTIQLIKKSVLKQGYRAFFINKRSEVETSSWYRNYLLGEKGLFYVEGSGVYSLANVDLADNELYFEKTNLPSGYKPWIFYSWQSDYDLSRQDIKSAIESAIREINSDRNPKVPIELVESTRLEDGADNIISAIKRNIDRSLLAVFDITNVSEVPRSAEKPIKAYPNSNVVFEMSYALQRKRPDQIILVKKKRKDIGNDVPFDFYQNLNLQYANTGEASKKIKKQIVENLGRLQFIG